MHLIPRRFSTIASMLLIFALMFFPLVPTVQASTTPLAPDTENASELLQFTSQGHVLGFSKESVIFAQTRHMLKVDFLNGNKVIPEADGVTQGEDDKAEPLDRVTYKQIWNGVTAVYEAHDSSIAKSTYYVDDGAHANRIRLGYNRPIQLDQKGNLIIFFEDGTMTESAPIAWQEVEGRRIPVEAAFALDGQEVGYVLGEYLPGIPVIIDPDLSWNTFLGGSSDDYGFAIAVDGSQNVYVAGDTSATWGTPVRDFTSGQDAFVAKLDSSGVLVWNTFLGGSGTDTARRLLLDASGNVYVVGRSNATWGTPILAYNAGEDMYAAKLDNDGALVWHSFVGGAGNERGQAIALDGSGNVYVTGRSTATWGTPVRAYVLGTEATVAKLDSDGALVWNTFLGGSGSDWAFAMVVDSSENVYIAGNSNATWESPVRAYTLGNDGFTAKLDSSGALVWNTFLGGSGSDQALAMAIDGSGNIYVTGDGTATWGSPVRAFSAGSDAYAAKINTSGELVWNTFLGGSGSDQGLDIALDTSQNAYIIAKSTASWGEPVRAYTSGEDAVIVKIDNSGALTWNTFLGGSGSSEQGLAIAVDSSRNVYGTGYSNATWGSPLRSYTLGIDTFVAKLLNDEAPAPSPGRTYIPNIAVTKDATPPSLPNGPGEVTYNYVVKNWGQITLTDITLKDDQCADVIFIEGDQNGNGWLETNEEWTYRCTQFLSETTVNFATARGLGGGLAATDTAIKEVFVGPPTAAPSIHVVKSAEPESLPADGGEVLYTYELHNTGEPALSNITVMDDRCASIEFVSGDENANQLLDQDEAWTYTCRQTVTENTQNTVVVTGDGNGRTAIDTAVRTVVVAEDVPPVIHMLKKPEPIMLPEGGGWVTYTYEVQNPGNVSLSNVKVTDDDCTEIVHISGEINDNGMLDPDESWIFTCRKFINQTTLNTAMVEGSHENHTVSNIAVANVTVGNGALTHSLIKLRCTHSGVNDPCRAVYYVGSDGFRHVFPNENTFFSWYQNFNDVIIVDEALMSSIALGANITYKPGVKMVKFITDLKVYAVARYGVLRWIMSEDLVSQLYGADWNTKVDDINSAFFGDYTTGTDISSPDDYDPSAEETSGTTPSDSL